MKDANVHILQRSISDRKRLFQVLPLRFRTFSPFTTSMGQSVVFDDRIQQTLLTRLVERYEDERHGKEEGLFCLLPTKGFQHTRGYRAQRFGCPLLFPEPTGQTCAHEQFAKEKGCVKDLNWEQGGLMRVLLQRHGPLYHAIYHQRTSCERINSQAQALGIERPKVRNGRSVRNLNTLMYLIINARVLAKAHTIHGRLLQQQQARPAPCKVAPRARREPTPMQWMDSLADFS